MKKFLLSISLTLVATLTFGQYQWGIDFDTPSNLDRVYNDTFSNPNCIWQIGHANKSVFTLSHTVPNAIMTDTLNPVPANDTSTFYLFHINDTTIQNPNFGIQFWYQIDGDSTDFGMIEISPDGGNTWVNILTEDTTYDMGWWSPKPTLKGTASGWQYFYVMMNTWASGMGAFPVTMTSDTIYYRFTYITDSSSVPHDGWMIDDFQLEDWGEGITDIQNDNLIRIAPNPVSDELIVRRTKVTNNQRIQIFSFTGQVLYDNPCFMRETIDTRLFPGGIYLLKYSDAEYFSIKRFVVQH